MDWQTDIFKEKSFWQVYRKARTVTGSDFNKLATFLVFVFLSISILTLFCVAKAYKTDPNAPVIWVRDWATLGTAYSTGILGFLITGFSIFATITKNELFEALAQIPYKVDNRDTGLSQFKFIFFNFAIVFVHYLGFLFTCIAINLFAGSNGVLTLFARDLFGSKSMIGTALACAIAVVIGTWFFHIVLMLKSFIWNLYQSVLLSIAAEAELRKHRDK